MQLALKAGVDVTSISNLAIWGNHSATMYPDFYNARIDGRHATEAITDLHWLQGEFITTVQQRGSSIIKARGLSSAASAANAVVDTVRSFLPWYSSVHRGTGFASQVCTRAYEAARAAVASFAGARSTDEVIFVRNTTEALNLLARCVTLQPDHVVLSTALEHHSNMLPWRRLAKVVYLEPPPTPEAEGGPE